MGRAIIDAYNIEKTLDLTGIVLQEGLDCAASTEAEITFSNGTKKMMQVPTHTNSMAHGENVTDNFKILRTISDERYAKRYENSEPVVAAMLKVARDRLKANSKKEAEGKTNK